MAKTTNKTENFTKLHIKRIEHSQHGECEQGQFFFDEIEEVQTLIKLHEVTYLFELVGSDLGTSERLQRALSGHCGHTCSLGFPESSWPVP